MTRQCEVCKKFIGKNGCKNCKKPMIKYYKVLVDGKACSGGMYEYDLPKLVDGKWVPGMWTTPIKNPYICERGYHLTTDPFKWVNHSCKIYLAECKDVIEIRGDKIVSSSVRLLELVTFNIGKDNTGEYNSGNSNSGNSNSGNSNSGDRNSGNRNSGDSNSGDRNSGESNSGYGNSGESNSGHGHFGAFNTTIAPRMLFNKLISEEEYQVIDFPSWTYIEVVEWVEVEEMCCGGYYKKIEYKEAWKKAFEKASVQGIKDTLNIPNFDYDVFEEITGITKIMIKR